MPGASDKMKNEPWPHIMDYTKAIADKEVVRAKMAAAKAGAPAELFTMSLAPEGQGRRAHARLGRPGLVAGAAAGEVAALAGAVRIRAGSRRCV